MTVRLPIQAYIVWLEQELADLDRGLRQTLLGTSSSLYGWTKVSSWAGCVSAAKLGGGTTGRPMTATSTPDGSQLLSVLDVVAASMDQPDDELLRVAIAVVETVAMQVR